MIMALDSVEFENLKRFVLDKISIELSNANRTNSIEEYLTRIKCDDLLQKYNQYYVRDAKIIVIGASAISVKEMQGVAKKLGINPNKLDLHLDYKKNERFNIAFLQNNVNYSDIIIGPNAHKMTGIGDYSSVISMIKDNSESYPKLTIASDNTSLKITKTSFENCLKNTQYYLDNIQI